MKTLFLLLFIFVIGCSGPVVTGDIWQGMTPAEHADMLMDKPDKKATGLSRSEKEALMQLLEVGARAGSGAVPRAMIK